MVVIIMWFFISACCESIGRELFMRLLNSFFFLHHFVDDMLSSIVEEWVGVNDCATEYTEFHKLKTTDGWQRERVR